ncbi:serine hydrolase domain-containing protein [Microbacterium sp. 13-71-7]|uniref:serine hydrolase domain-containing protein n=1 Tax=Microbacterium sp. 13-71-7 TaxID=1970399 RepID=UPI000BC77EBE|nr:serine hydrolase domain-containing protein [Microbacterium sp. 13-71-7]OZB85360.1 MAG: 2', 3'-cyclic nucleotide 2'-phosphodiesterase [Microbacterium sp. 13-71-7]
MTAVDDAALLGHARTALAARLDAPTLRRSPASLAAITHRGAVIAASAHGEPRRDGAPTTPGTIFRIASMSKSFLAATALSLRDEGLLDLHAPAAEYVPGIAAARFDDEPFSLTLDALLSNRGGLGEDNAWGDEHLGSSREEMAAHVEAGLRPATRPGTEYRYSNLGISLIGRAIEAVTGRDVEDVVRARLLDPLGLTDTRASADLYPAGSDLAAGFRTFDDGAAFTPEPYVGSGALACIGSLFSTASDIAAWMHFLGSAFESGASPADGVLRAASRREMQTARTLIPTSAWTASGRVLDGAGYGYGTVVEHDRRFGRVVQHAGGLPGFSSHMRWHTATGIGVVVFGNSDSFGAGSVAGDLLSDVLGLIDAPAALVRPWPETLEAARRIDALLRAGRPLTDAAELLARNVLRDVPADVRSSRLAEALAETGAIRPATDPFPERIVSASDRSALRWTIPCERGALVCDLRMIGLHDPLVQEIAILPAGEDGRKPRDEPAHVTDHHRLAPAQERTRGVQEGVR